MADSLLRVGARIQATSNDERYPPRSIIDGRADTFWATGGIYPQQFTITFPSMVTMKSVTIYCYKVRELMLEKSTKQIPIKFEAVAEKELERKENDLNVELLVNGEFAAHHLRFTIRAAYDHFCSVHKVTLGGVKSTERGAADENVNSANFLAVGGENVEKMSPRHPKSAMRRRRESLAQGSPVKLGVEDDDSDDQAEEKKENQSNITMVSGSSTNFNSERGPNLLQSNRRLVPAGDDVLDVRDEDDDGPDLSLG